MRDGGHVVRALWCRPETESRGSSPPLPPTPSSAMALPITAIEPGAGDQPVCLRLLGGFELSYQGHPLDVPMASQRILALLALRNQPMQRAYVAGTLWPNYNEERATANLRTA